MADFFARTKLLEEMVGDGILKGEFAANKVYAVNQHEKGWRNFLGYMGPKDIERYHRGGGPKFVETPLKERFALWYQEMADEVLEGGLEGAMESAMQDLDSELKRRAPIDSGDLRNSGTYTVYDGERVAAHKPSQVPYKP
jgi:hypothetical protein